MFNKWKQEHNINLYFKISEEWEWAWVVWFLKTGLKMLSFPGRFLSNQNQQFSLLWGHWKWSVFDSHGEKFSIAKWMSEWSILREEFQVWFLLQWTPAPFSKAWRTYSNSSLHLLQRSLPYQIIELPLKSEVCQPDLSKWLTHPLLHITFSWCSLALFIRVLKSDYRDFSSGPVLKNPPADAKDMSVTPGVGKSGMLQGN